MITVTIHYDLPYGEGQEHETYKVQTTDHMVAVITAASEFRIRFTSASVRTVVSEMDHDYLDAIYLPNVPTLPSR